MDKILIRKDLFAKYCGIRTWFEKGYENKLESSTLAMQVTLSLIGGWKHVMAVTGNL